jgi:oligosaccharide repeat unit polymerase
MLPIGIALLLSSQVQNVLGDDLMNLYAGVGNMGEYLILCEVIYFSFLAGDTLGRRQRVRSSGKLKPVSETILFMFSIMGGLIAAIAMFQARDILLKGKYVTDTDLNRGFVAASSIFIFLPAVIHIFQTRPSTLKQLLWNRYMILFWPANLILFLSGGRLYFISFLLVLVVFWTSFTHRPRVARLAVFLLGAIILMGIVGAYRQAGSDDHSIIANLLREPMFTSLSLASFLGSHKFYLWNFPTYLGSDLINLVPSAVFPGKLSLMKEVPDVYAPLGALNSFVSFQWNFGIVGTMIFMFLLGYFLARLRRRLDLWSHVAYVLTCGWLPFTFFRDAFSISLIKNILEFSLLLPAAIIAISRFVTWAVGGRHLFSPEGSNGAEPASDEDLPKF